MNQKAVTIASMCLVIFGAVMVNEFVVKTSDAEQDRDVASFGERFEPTQIKWEHELAKTISQDGTTKTVLGTRPNAQDRLLFEVFEGRYEAQMAEGKISRIALLPNQSPIELKTETFMKEYAAVIKDFHSYEQKSTEPGEDSIHLKNKTGEVVGELVISRDDRGRIISVEIQ